MTNSCFWKYWPTWASSFEGIGKICCWFEIRECSMRHIFQLELSLFKYLSMIWWFYFISMREMELSSQCPHVLPSIVGRPPNDMRMLEFVWNNSSLMNCQKDWDKLELSSNGKFQINIRRRWFATEMELDWYSKERLKKDLDFPFFIKFNGILLFFPPRKKIIILLAVALMSRHIGIEYWIF